MYTIEILNKDINKENQNLILSVRFSNGNTTFDKKYNFDPKIKDAEILQRLKLETERLELAASKSDKINIGTIDLSGVVSQPEIDTDVALRQEWITNFQRLERANKLISLGVLKENDSEYSTLLAWMIANRKPGYLNYI